MKPQAHLRALLFRHPVAAVVNGSATTLVPPVTGIPQITGPGTLTVTVVTSSNFSSWITGTFANGTVTTQGPNDDNDKDGISNLVEFSPFRRQLVPVFWSGARAFIVTAAQAPSNRGCVQPGTTS